MRTTAGRKRKQIRNNPAVRIRHKKVLSNVLAGSTMAESLKKAGYAPGSNLTRSDSFQEMLAKAMPDDVLLETHTELLKSHRIIKDILIPSTDDDVIQKAISGLDNVSIIKNEAEGHTILVINSPDRQAQKEALELAYRVKGHFSNINLKVKREYENMSDDELKQLYNSIVDDDDDDDGTK